MRFRSPLNIRAAGSSFSVRRRRSFAQVFPGAIDLSGGILVLWLLFVAVIKQGTLPEDFLAGILPYVAVFSVAQLISSMCPGVAEIIMVLLFDGIGLYESVLGVLQVRGVHPSGHAIFSLTGSFRNPGPYGALIAIVVAVSVAYCIRTYPMLKGIPVREWRRHGVFWKGVTFCVSLMTAFGGLVVLPASMSRAAWAGLFVAGAVACICSKPVRSLFHRNRWLLLCSFILVIAAGGGVFALKKESALGRIHIWHMEMRALKEAPLFGYGPGNEMGAYGMAQEAYFRSASRSAVERRVAGCPEYAFNEYLHLGLAGGIPALSLALVCLSLSLVLLLRSHSPFAYGLVVWAVFAFFSYPLSVPLLAFFLSALLGFRPEPSGHERAIGCGLVVLSSFCGIAFQGYFHSRQEAVRTYAEARRWVSYEMYDDAVQALAPLYGKLRGNFRYLYDYGYSLHKTGDYERSNAILGQGALISSDPLFHVIRGRNQEAQGDILSAEREYLTAHYMVPGRLYPLVLLMELQEKEGDHVSAMMYARAALEIPVNRRNANMVRLNERARQCADTLLTNKK